MQPTPEISVIIVNWNAHTLLRPCVMSLSRGGVPMDAVEVIVVDNASSDDSLLHLSDLAFVRIVRNAENRGFAAACNLGVEHAQGRFILFFNPDCELIDPAFSACIAEMDRHPQRVGALSVRLVDPEGRTWRSCQVIPGWGMLMGIATGLGRLIPGLPRSHFMLDWPHDSDRDVGNILGAFYFMRREVFLRLGGFDSRRFFVYWEDVDLSKQLADSGRVVRYLHGPRVQHLGGGTTNRVKAFRLFLTTRSRIQYAFKHLPGWQAWTHLVASALIEPLMRLAERLARGRWSEAREVLQAFAMLYRDLPSIVAIARAG